MVTQSYMYAVTWMKSGKLISSPKSRGYPINIEVVLLSRELDADSGLAMINQSHVMRHHSMFLQLQIHVQGQKEDRYVIQGLIERIHHVNIITTTSKHPG